VGWELVRSRAGEGKRLPVVQEKKGVVASVPLQGGSDDRERMKPQLPTSRPREKQKKAGRGARPALSAKLFKRKGKGNRTKAGKSRTSPWRGEKKFVGAF